MFGKLPATVDPRHYLSQAIPLCGELPLASLPRLIASTRRVEGAARLTAQFERDADGLVSLRGQLQAKLYLTCQRCLGELEWGVETDLALALVATEAEAARWQADHDVLVVTGAGVNLAELLEDELLLSIPLAPRHGCQRECDADMVGRLAAPPDVARPSECSPFAVLATLKGDDADLADG